MSQGRSGMSTEYPDPGETLHRVVTDCPDLWDELDAEDKAGWARDEAEVVVGACHRTSPLAGEPLQGERIQLIRLEQLRGKDCTYGNVAFHACPYVQTHMDELRKAEEERSDD